MPATQLAGDDNDEASVPDRCGGGSAHAGIVLKSGTSDTMTWACRSGIMYLDGLALMTYILQVLPAVPGHAAHVTDLNEVSGYGG